MYSSPKYIFDRVARIFLKVQNLSVFCLDIGSFFADVLLPNNPIEMRYKDEICFYFRHASKSLQIRLNTCDVTDMCEFYCKYVVCG